MGFSGVTSFANTVKKTMQKHKLPATPLAPSCCSELMD